MKLYTLNRTKQRIKQYTKIQLKRRIPVAQLSMFMPCIITKELHLLLVKKVVLMKMKI